jgi:hypothetical protein
MSVPSAHGFNLKIGFEDTTSASIDLNIRDGKRGGFREYMLFGMVITST